MSIHFLYLFPIGRIDEICFWFVMLSCLMICANFVTRKSHPIWFFGAQHFSCQFLIHELWLKSTGVLSHLCPFRTILLNLLTTMVGHYYKAAHITVVAIYSTNFYF